MSTNKFSTSKFIYFFVMCIIILYLSALPPGELGHAVRSSGPLAQVEYVWHNGLLPVDPQNIAGSNPNQDPHHGDMIFIQT